MLNILQCMGQNNKKWYGPKCLVLRLRNLGIDQSLENIEIFLLKGEEILWMLIQYKSVDIKGISENNYPLSMNLSESNSYYVGYIS